MADTPPIIDVKRFIDEQRFSPYQWGILATCFLMIAIDTYDAFAVGFVVPVLMQEWHIGKALFGPVMSASIFGMAVGALVSGPLYDRTTPKTVMVGSMILFGLCSLGSTLAQTPLQLGIWRLVTGLGIGAAVPGATTLVYEYAPARRGALVVNTMACGGMVGAARLRPDGRHADPGLWLEKPLPGRRDRPHRAGAVRAIHHAGAVALHGAARMAGRADRRRAAPNRPGSSA
ncbi:MFS transporter [Cupriavidus basilensis]